MKKIISAEFTRFSKHFNSCFVRSVSICRGKAAQNKTILVFMKVAIKELYKKFLTDTEHPNIIPEDNEHV